MRILIVLPRQEMATGNEVTAQRHCAGLIALGHEVSLARVTLDGGPALQTAVRTLTPDIVHLLHAYRSGTPWLAADVCDIPYVVTLTGTDINGGIDTPAEGPTIRRILAGAAKVITQNRLTAAQLPLQLPALAKRVVYLPPGIVLGSALAPWQRRELFPSEHTLFFHPAGIRPVKGNLELLDLFAPLARAGLPFSVAFCGPALDAGYSTAFFAAVAACPWARYLGVIPPAAMPAILRQVDVVLNNSVSEGLSNALLEAAVLGVPMLVRRIPGNLAIVDPGRNGLIYEDAAAFAVQARTLIEDPALRQRLSLPEQECYAPAAEAQTLAALYAAAISAGSES